MKILVGLAAKGTQQNYVDGKGSFSFSFLPSPFSLLPSPFSLLPSPFFLRAFVLFVLFVVEIRCGSVGLSHSQT